MESIHKRIKRLREAKGLSQEKLGRAVGVKYQSVQEWEQEGGTAPRRTRLAKVAAALGVTPHELLSGSPEPSVAHVEAEKPKEQDPRAGKVAALFYWLTEDQKQELLKEVTAMATTNRLIAREIGGKVQPVTNARVEQALKKKTKR